jgi:prepilin-type N-terminal cleavage/methylation domain-containing protein
VRRLKSEAGFGLVELLIAMVVMAIGITGIVAAFTSGIVALSRANQIGTAGTLADKQMEAYRALPFSEIALSVAGTGAPYTPITGDTQTGSYDITACTTGCVFSSGPGLTYCSAAPTSWPSTCTAVQSPVTGPDGRTYRVDTYVVWYCAVGTLHDSTYNSATYTQTAPGCTDTSTPPVAQSEPVKQVTVVVRDATTTSKTYVRETSTFDPNT